MFYLIAFVAACFLGLIALEISFFLLAPVAGAVVAAVAAWLVLVEFASASSVAFSGRAPIDRINILPPTDDGTGTARDPAYRSYFFGPVLYEYRFTVQVAVQRAWDRLFAGSVGQGIASAQQSLLQRVFASGRQLTNWPLKLLGIGPLVGAIVGLVLGTLFAAVVTGMYALVFGAVLVLVVAATTFLALVLRVFEFVSLRIRGISLECPSCSQRATSPVYVCAHCPEFRPALHRRLVPGSHGLLRRTCRCGDTLPTTLAGGKWKLAARCQGCGTQLPVKGLTAPTFHVPVVAGTAAGKTVFMMAATATMETRARADGSSLKFEFADPGAKQQYVAARKALEQASFGNIAPTLPGVALRAYNVYVESADIDRKLLYLYDSAGERYQHRESLDNSSFLRLTKGVILIVDPFALESVRGLMGAQELAAVHASDVSPEEVLSRFGQALRESVHARPDRRLDVGVSVVVTKADALVRGGRVAHPYDDLGEAARDPGLRAQRSDAVRRWLVNTGGQRSLIAVVENSFSHCEYFVVSALDAFTVSVVRGRSRTALVNDDPSAPLRRLLERRRIPA